MSADTGTPSPLYNRIINFCLIAILIFTPLALGAKRLWAITPVYLVTLTAMCLLLLRLNARGVSEFRWTPLGAPLALFLALTLWSCYISVYHHDSIMALFRVSAYIAIFYLIVNGVDTKARMVRLVGTVVGMGALLSFIGLILYLGHAYYSYWLPGDTLSATYMNRDHFAGYLEMVIPLAVALLYTDIGREKKALAGFCVVLMVVAFVLAASRGAWVSLLASSLLIPPFVHRKKLLKRVLLGLILCAIASYFALSHFDLSVAAARAKTIFEGVGIDETRVQMWMGAVDLIKARPLTGWGIGTFIYVFPQIRPVGIFQGWTIDYAHNDYLHMAAELGLPVLLLMAWVIIGAFWSGLREFSNSEGSYKRSVLLGACIGMMSMAFHSLVDFNLHIPANAIMFMTLIGIIMTMSGRRRYERRALVDIVILILFVAACALVMAPAVAEVYAGRAVAFEQAKRIDSAMRAYKTAIGIDPLNARYYSELGRLYLKKAGGVADTGLRSASRDAYAKAIRLNPYNSIYRLGWAEAEALLLADKGAISAGELSRYVEDLRKAVAISPNNYFVNAAAGYHILRFRKLISPKDRNFAIYRMRYAMELNPAYANKVFSYVANGLGDFNLLYKVTPQTPQWQQALRDFLRDIDRWKYRK